MSLRYDAIATRMASLQQTMQEALTKRMAISLPMEEGLRQPPITPPILIAASKAQSAEAITMAIKAGVQEFGENRVQEAQEKWPVLKAAYPNIKLHFIGALQSNKAIEAVSLFDIIQTIDRPKIVDALADAEHKLGLQRTYYIQVNIGEEPQKGGVLPLALPELLAHCRLRGLNIVGLMAVPPAGANPAPYFALLAKLAAQHALPNLSMGMSHDFDVAIRLGATHVRIGTALFGERL